MGSVNSRSPMNQETLEPTFRGRVTIAVLYVVGFAWYVSFKLLLAPITKEVTKMAYCDSIPWVRGEVLYFSILMMMPSVLFLFQGYRILKFKQWPLPDAYVWRSTVIQSGFWVTFQGYFFLLVGIAIPVAMIISLIAFPEIITLLFGSPSEIGCA